MKPAPTRCRGIAAALGLAALAAAEPRAFELGVTPSAPTPEPVVAIAIADFDGDGVPDVAAACSERGVAVLLGAGDGTFGPARVFPAGIALQGVIAADLDGDGVPDVAAANRDDVAVLRGLGDGTFAAPEHLAAGGAPGAIVAGDFDGDHHLDLAVTDKGRGTVSILLGHGDGTFQPARSYAAVPHATMIAAADLDGDGALDVLAASKRDGYVALFGRGDGSFRTARPVATGLGTLVNAIALGDLDGDGEADLVLASSGATGDRLAVGLSQGDGTFRAIAAPELPPPQRPTALTTADLDGDGHLDLVVGIASGTVARALLGDGHGSFHEAGTFGVWGYPRALAAVDLDGDGKLDLVSGGDAFGGLSVLEGRGDGTFQGERVLLVPANTRRVVAGDFDGDGFVDLVLFDAEHEPRYRVLHGDGSGGLHPSAEGSLGSLKLDAEAIAVDVNGDGHLDLLSADRTTLLLGNGDGTFQAPRAQEVEATGLAPADFDGDGKLDLALSVPNARSVVVVLGKGDGGFGPAQWLPDGEYDYVFSVAAGDLDADGKPDIAATTDRGLVVLYGKGDGTFEPWQRVSGDSAASLAAADFDGDGRTDLAAASCAYGTLTVFRNTGQRPLVVAEHGPSSGLCGMQARDVNADGLVDLVSWSAARLSNGDGTFQPLRGFGVGGSSFAYADLDGDGLPELVVTQPSTRFLRISGNRSRKLGGTNR